MHYRWLLQKLRPKVVAVALCAFVFVTFPYFAYRIFCEDFMSSRSLLQRSLSQFVEQVEEAKDVRRPIATTYDDPLILVDSAGNLSIGGCYSFVFDKPKGDVRLNRKPRLRHTTSTSNNNSWIAILVPYRDRALHLRTFIPAIHTFLHEQFEMRKKEAKQNGQRQFPLRYCVFVIEQTFDARFNRGILFNIGYIQARRLYPRYNFTCWIFHDVDLIPENIRLLYECFPPPKLDGNSPNISKENASTINTRISLATRLFSNQSNKITVASSTDSVKHLVVGIDQFNYTLLYAINVGGVLAVREDQFVSVNGYSNLYFGYGGEDDDFYQRLKAYNIGIYRQPVNVSRYKALRSAHVQAEPNLIVMALLSKAAERMPSDGLNVYVGDTCHQSGNSSDPSEYKQEYESAGSFRCLPSFPTRFPKVKNPADIKRLVVAMEKRRGYSWMLVRVCTTSPSFECQSRGTVNHRINILHQHGHDFNEHYYR